MNGGGRKAAGRRQEGGRKAAGRRQEGGRKAEAIWVRGRLACYGSLDGALDGQVEDAALPPHLDDPAQLLLDILRRVAIRDLGCFDHDLDARQSAVIAYGKGHACSYRGECCDKLGLATGL